MTPIEDVLRAILRYLPDEVKEAVRSIIDQERES